LDVEGLVFLVDLRKVSQLVFVFAIFLGDAEVDVAFEEVTVYVLATLGALDTDRVFDHLLLLLHSLVLVV